jgi:hypothetical protein
MRPSHAGRRAALLAALAALLVSTQAAGNGVEARVDPDKPVPPSTDRVLPFPVVEEATSRAPSPFAELPRDLVHLTTPDLATGVKQDGPEGQVRHHESLFVRDARVSKAKVTIAAGGVRYTSERWPGAVPLGRDALQLGGTPRAVVDLAQSIVTRKDITLSTGDSVVLGSHVIGYAGSSEVANTRGGGLVIASLAGLDWGRVGLGGFEVSLNQPAWSPKTFRHGLFQGRAEDVNPRSIKLAWLSATRTDAIVLADKREFGGRVKTGTEIPLAGGKKIKVVRVDASKRVDLETPEGARTLSVDPDARRSLEDTEVRKKLVFVGKEFAVALDPSQSDFPKVEAHLEVHSGLHVHKHGEPLDVDPAWRVYPLATYAGRVVGVHMVSDKPIELTPAAPTADGPGGSIRLLTSWTPGGELEWFGVDDGKGGKSPRVPAAGRASMNLVAGSGPTAESLLAHTGAAAAASLAAAIPQPSGATPDAGATAPASSAAAAPAAPAPTDPIAIWRPRAPWIGAGAAAGLLLGFLIGRAGGGRRRNRYDDDDY